MVLQCEFSIGFFDFFALGSTGDTEALVVVAGEGRGVEAGRGTEGRRRGGVGGEEGNEWLEIGIVRGRGGGGGEEAEVRRGEEGGALVEGAQEEAEE